VYHFGRLLGINSTVFAFYSSLTLELFPQFFTHLNESLAIQNFISTKLWTKHPSTKVKKCLTLFNTNTEEKQPRG
jgi:hypothetical protein